VGIGILLRAFKLAKRQSYRSILDLKVKDHKKNIPSKLSNLLYPSKYPLLYPIHPPYAATGLSQRFHSLDNLYTECELVLQLVIIQEIDHLIYGQGFKSANVLHATAVTFWKTVFQRSVKISNRPQILTDGQGWTSNLIADVFPYHKTVKTSSTAKNTRDRRQISSLMGMDGDLIPKAICLKSLNYLAHGRKYDSQQCSVRFLLEFSSQFLHVTRGEHVLSFVSFMINYKLDYLLTCNQVQAKVLLVFNKHLILIIYQELRWVQSSAKHMLWSSLKVAQNSRFLQTIVHLGKWVIRSCIPEEELFHNRCMNGFDARNERMMPANGLLNHLRNMIAVKFDEASTLDEQWK
ncbi:hypothetical protein KI387_011941, partial [Taxus chinensis]